MLRKGLAGVAWSTGMNGIIRPNRAPGPLRTFRDPWQGHDQLPKKITQHGTKRHIGEKLPASSTGAGAGRGIRHKLRGEAAHPDTRSGGLTEVVSASGGANGQRFVVLAAGDGELRPRTQMQALEKL